jgi:hypothetical protein
MKTAECIVKFGNPAEKIDQRKNRELENYGHLETKS